MSRAPRNVVSPGAAVALTTAALLAALFLPVGAVTQQPLQMDQYLHARWPSRPTWSPDGRYLGFLWTDWKTQDVYLVSPQGGKPIQLTRSEDFFGGSTWNSAGQFGEWSPDGARILYSDRGDLFSVSVPDGKVTQLTDTADSETGPRFSPDGARIAFTRAGGVYVFNCKDGTTKQLGRNVRLGGGGSWSPDGRWLSASVGDPPTRITATPEYSGSFITFMVPRGSQRDAAIVSTETGKAQVLLSSPDNESVVDWAPDSKSVLVQRVSINVKERTIFLWSLDDGRSRELFRERDERYLGGDQIARFSPDGKWVLFTSERDGWNHIYTVPTNGGEPKQITSGAFEVSSVSLAADGRTIFFVSTEGGSEQRHVYSVPAAGGPRTRLTKEAGVNATATLSPRGDRIAFIHSDPAHLPDLWVMDTSAGGPRQLTESMTPELRAFNWQTPQIVTYKGEGGLPIKAQLFTPQPLQRSVRYPAIVHVHQAAAYQEVYLGPGPAKDNVGWYGWHQRLSGSGYVVLNVDFRGSTGYGRDFRSGNYLDVGVGDAADVIKGVEYLKTLDYVDTSRLGVYGMSYGGHMVLTLLSKYPDVFKAGINIAGVFDFQVETGPWDTRNAWMNARLGSPEQNPKAYFNASASNFIDNLKAPVMTIQGTNDSNVTFLQSVKLVDELLKRGKTFEFEMYPGEVHFFGRRQSWVDAFAKMERFFDTYLKPGASASQ